MTSSADRKEPPPVAPPIEMRSMQQEMLEDLLAFAPDQVMSQVASDLALRMDYGLKKYGTLLHAHNGRNAVMDAYQEGLDLAVYLKQCIVEGKLVSGEYYEVLGILRSLRQRL